MLIEHHIPDRVPLCYYNYLHSSGKPFGRNWSKAADLLIQPPRALKRWGTDVGWKGLGRSQNSSSSQRYSAGLRSDLCAGHSSYFTSTLSACLLNTIVCFLCCNSLWKVYVDEMFRCPQIFGNIVYSLLLWDICDLLMQGLNETFLIINFSKTQICLCCLFLRSKTSKQ